MGILFWGLFDRKRRNAENAEKCFTEFLTRIDQDSYQCKNNTLFGIEFSLVQIECGSLVFSKVVLGDDFPITLHNFVREQAPVLRQLAQERINRNHLGGAKDREHQQKIIDYLNSLDKKL
jgi:hypothetical protein